MSKAHVYPVELARPTGGLPSLSRHDGYSRRLRETAGTAELNPLLNTETAGTGQWNPLTDPRPVTPAGRCARCGGATWHHQAHDICGRCGRSTQHQAPEVRLLRRSA